MTAKSAQAVELRRSGLSLERIAGDLGESLSKVSRWCQAAEKRGVLAPQPAGRSGRPRKARPANASTAPRAAGASAATPATPPTATALPGPPGATDIAAHLASLDVPADLAVVRATWLPRCRELADAGFAGGDSQQARDWMKLYLETAERLLAATPRPPPNPEDDPAYALARDRVRKRIARIIRQAEAVATEEAADAAS